MKYIKSKISHAAFAFVVVIILVGLSGCNQCGKYGCENGTCVNGVCQCEPGWSGADCSQFNPCAGIECGHGACVEGDCICDTGYEGNHCDQRINSKFAANYELSETCNPTGMAGPYPVAIASPSNEPTLLLITGMWEEDQVTVAAEVKSIITSSFTIIRQGLTPDYDIQGEGTVNANGEVSIDYEILDAATEMLADDCSATLVRQ